MKVKVLLIIVVILGSGMALLFGQSEASVTQLSADAEASILASTIQIAMYEHALEPGSSEAGGDGLGTVIAYGGERLIITHDHWSHINPNLTEVEFRNWMGQLLVTLDAHAFQSLILYRDGGTMVLRVPAGLENIPTAEVGTAAVEGDVVWVARRDVKTGRQTVELFPAAVTAVEIGSGQAKMRLQTLAEGAVIPGDSGGGVWVNGRLVANNWASVMTEKSSLLADLFGAETVQPTSLVIVTLQPFGTQLGINNTLQTDNQVEQTELADGNVKEGMLQEILLAE